MIKETVIEKAIDLLAGSTEFDDRSEEIIESHPALIAYLGAEGFEILTSEEKDLLWYCCVVILVSIEIQDHKIPEVTVEMISEAEELNYDRLRDDNIRFSEMADELFEGYEEEDLLAFVEDTLIPDEENFITPVGRKVLFISLKTIIDVFAGRHH